MPGPFPPNEARQGNSCAGEIFATLTNSVQAAVMAGLHGGKCCLRDLPLYSRLCTAAIDIKTRDNVGIFSLFGKKEAPQKKTAEKDASRIKRPATPARPEKENTERALRRDTQRAQETVLKIDA